MLRYCLLACGAAVLGCTMTEGIPKMVRGLAIIFAASVCIITIITPAIIAAARKAGAMDHPDARKIHTRPTPRWGGIAVFIAFAAALMLASTRYMPNLQAMLTASFLILLVGALDDLRGVNAATKLVVQLFACVLVIVDGVHVTFLPASWGMWGIAGEWAITIIWIVGITNALNFLDGMNGLLCGLVAGTSCIYFILAILLGADMLAYCAVALFGTSLCFLSFNVKPARIFLGDGGSTFLGFFLAVLSIQGEWARDEPLVSFFIPILVLSVPIYDMVFITVARIASGRVRSLRSWLEYTGKDHLHHRLERLGLTRPAVVLSICFLNVGIGLGAIALLEARTYGGVALIAQAVFVYVIVALLEVLGRRHYRDI